MLGVARAGGGELERAIGAFDAALERRSGFVQALAQKARALVELNRRPEAAGACDAAIALAPVDPYTLDTLGVVLTRLGRHAQAAEFYERAAKKTNAPGYFYNLAAAQQFLGDFDEARTAYRACLQRAPRHGRAWSGLVQITRQTPAQNEIGRLEAMFEQVKGHPDGSLEVGHALAKAHEDLGDSAAAMNWLARAKALTVGSLKTSAETDAALFAAAERLAEVRPAADHCDAAPIFVSGMPRTGTTLVERIVSSHSSVSSAGELPDFPIALNEALGELQSALFRVEAIERAGDVEPGAIGKAYIQSVQAILKPEGRFVDKLPPNVLLAPLILAALPDARVIVLRRHPADSVLANYRQIFARGAGYLDYTYDLERAARYYVGFERMLRVFRDRLAPDRFMEVAYEDIVSDLEGQTRRLLDFCGLAFEAACLNFHENRSPVATASAAQARQPIYASSVGRWKACRPALDPALRVLVDAGLMSEGEAFG